MTPEQSVAYVQAQTAAMLADLEAMKVENATRAADGLTFAYDEQAFFNLPARYGITHNQVMELFL